MLRDVKDCYINLLLDKIEYVLNGASFTEREETSDYLFIEQMMKNYEDKIRHQHTCHASKRKDGKVKVSLMVPKRGRGKRGGGYCNHEKQWDCEGCIDYLRPREIRDLLFNYCSGFYYEIIPYKGRDDSRYGALKKRLTRAKAISYSVVSFKQALTLFISNIRIDAMQFVKWDDATMKSLLNRFLCWEPNSLNGCKKIRPGRRFKQYKPESKPKSGDYFIVDISARNEKEVYQRLEELGCKIDCNPEGISIEYSDVVLNYFWGLREGKSILIPLYGWDDPLGSARVRRKRND